MTDIEFSTEDLQLILRVLYFAEGELPIRDRKGGSLYPTETTKARAIDIIDRIIGQGITNQPGLYTPFDPEGLKDRKILIWQEAQDNDQYDLQIRGRVSAVLGSDSEGWSVAMGSTVLGPFKREELKSHVQIEMDLPQ